MLLLSRCTSATDVSATAWAQLILLVRLRIRATHCSVSCHVLPYAVCTHSGLSQHIVFRVLPANAHHLPMRLLLPFKCPSP